MNTNQAETFAEKLEAFGGRLNWLNERLCALLVAATVIVVWFGVIDRYVFSMGAVWTEELARYFMIWAALLAVPCCAYRREHIALDLLYIRLPANLRSIARYVIDGISLAFFLFLAYYSFFMVEQGKTEYATIFGMTMMVPFLSVTVCSILTCVQIVITTAREYFRTPPRYEIDTFYTQ